MQEHDAEIYREAYKTMAEAQKEHDRIIAVVCSRGTKANFKLAEEVGLDMNALLYIGASEFAGVEMIGNVLKQSSVAQVFNV